MGRLLQSVKDNGNGNWDFPDNSRTEDDQFSSSMKWAVIGSVGELKYIIILQVCVCMCVCII